MKKTSLFVLLTLITILGVGQASFAACSATSLTGTGPNGQTWGIEAYGQNYTTSAFDNILIQATFISGGTFAGTEWQTYGYVFSGPIPISGTWAMSSPASDCQGTITVTTGTGITPLPQTFNFTINNSNKGGVVVEPDLDYTIAGFMVYQASTLTCSSTTFKNKQFSLYSYGNIYGIGLVTGMGEIKFDKTGTTFSAVPALTGVTLDLGSSGNYVVPASGTSAIGSNCQGTGTLSVPALNEAFDVDTLVVGTGTEALWIVSDNGESVTGYFLQ